ncbi:MAG: hypothetical protein RIM99_12610 [Cyclobacteriaceae bacterium]
MKRIQIGDMVESDYGKGRVIAITDQWIIHDNSLNNGDEEFALLISDDIVHLVEEVRSA